MTRWQFSRPRRAARGANNASRTVARKRFSGGAIRPVVNGRNLAGEMPANLF